DASRTRIWMIRRWWTRPGRTSPAAWTTTVRAVGWWWGVAPLAVALPPLLTWARTGRRTVWGVAPLAVALPPLLTWARTGRRTVWGVTPGSGCGRRSAATARRCRPGRW